MNIRARILLYFGLLSALSAASFVVLWLYGLPGFGIEGIQTAEYRRSMALVESVLDKERSGFEHWMADRRHELVLQAGNELFGVRVRDAGKARVRPDLPARAALDRQLMALMDASPGAYNYLYVADAPGRRVLASSQHSQAEPPAPHASLFAPSPLPGVAEFMYLREEGAGLTVLITNEVHGTDAQGQPGAEVVGILVASLNLTAPLQGVEQTLRQTLGETGALVLLDAKSQVRIARGAGVDVNAVNFAYLGPMVEPDSSGAVLVRAPDGREVQMAYRDLHLGVPEGLSLLTLRASDEALASIRASFWRLCFLGLLIFLAAMVLFLIAAQRIARTEAQIRQLNAELEQRVLERTKELGVANSNLSETLTHLQTTRANLAQSEKLAGLGALVAGISHELNTPIGNALLVASSISEQTESFSSKAKTGLTRAALESHLSATSHGAEMMVTNLRRAAEIVVSFKQLAVDQTSGQRRRFSLASVAEEVGLSMRPMLKSLPFVLAMDIPADITLDGYPGELSGLLINMVNNAVLHGFEGRANGRMQIIARKISGESVEIVFSDDGQGMVPEVASRVFDPFFTTKLGRGGTGLGMNIAYNTVTVLLGGTIELHTAPGDGTRYKITLPQTAPSER